MTDEEFVKQRCPGAYDGHPWEQPFNFRIYVDWVGKPICINDSKHIGMQMSRAEAWADAARRIRESE